MASKGNHAWDLTADSSLPLQVPPGELWQICHRKAGL
jgi:hypothetical protein